MSLISASIEEHERGAWVAELVTTTTYEGSFIAGGSTWVGTIVGIPQKVGGRYKTTVVGGKGKLSLPIKERFYKGGASIATIFRDMLNGEQGQTSLTARAPTYQRQAGKLGEALDYLSDTYGVIWWVDRDGTLRLEKTRENGEITHGVVLERDVDTSVTLSVAKAEGIIPGKAFEGRIIRHVRWLLSPQSLRAELSFKAYEIPLVGVDYLKKYSAVVERQNADGSLDLVVNGRFGLTNVKWFSSIPANVQINQGDIVTVGFWAGDPRQPYAEGLNQITGGSPVARVGDTTNGGTLLIGQNVVSFAVAGMFIPPGPTHEAELAAALISLTASGTPVLIQLDLTSLIDSGQERVKI